MSGLLLAAALAGLCVPACVWAVPAWTLLWAEPSSDRGCLGATVANVRDVDGDGLSDIVVGAPRAVDGVCDGGSIEAVARLYSGLTGRLVRTLRPPVPASQYGNDGLGKSVSGPGDLDGDSIPDILIGAPYTGTIQDQDAGAVYAISGATGETIYSCPGAPGEFLGAKLDSGYDLDGDGVADFVASGVSSGTLVGFARAFSGATGNVIWTTFGRAQESFGASLLLLPDTDGDGVADLAVGATSCGSDGAGGGVYVLSGASGSPLRRLTPPWTCDGSQFGASLALVADLDGDSVPDLCVGRLGELQLSRGEVDIISVQGDSLIAKLPPVASDLGFGASLASGDVDGDAVVDAVIGAPNTLSSSGLWSGSISVWSGAMFPPVFRQTGWSVGQLLGEGVAVVGDTNGDGRQDVAVGAPGTQAAAGEPPVGGVAVFGLAEVSPAIVRLGTDGATMHLGLGSDAVRGLLEPAGQSFSLSDVRPKTLTLRRLSQPFRRARAASVDTTETDRDGDGIDDYAVVFSRSDVRAMYPNLGAAVLEDSVQVDATLTNGGRIQARLLAVIQPDADLHAARVSPNPILGRASLTVYTSTVGPFRVRMYDLNGRLVRTLVNETSAPPGYHDVSVETGTSATRAAKSLIYFLRVESADGVITRKVTFLR